MKELTLISQVLVGSWSRLLQLPHVCSAFCLFVFSVFDFCFAYMVLFLLPFNNYKKVNFLHATVFFIMLIVFFCGIELGKRKHGHVMVSVTKGYIIMYTLPVLKKSNKKHYWCLFPNDDMLCFKLRVIWWPRLLPQVKIMYLNNSRLVKSIQQTPLPLKSLLHFILCFLLVLFKLF